MAFYPEAMVSDNRWIVESWPKALEDAYDRDPKVISTEVEPPGTSSGRSPSASKTMDRIPTVLHFGHFFESVRTRQPYWEDAAAGNHAAACAHLINLSARGAPHDRVGFQARRHPRLSCTGCCGAAPATPQFRHIVSEFL